MNIHVIRDNLCNTIVGKEKMLEQVKQAVMDTEGTSHHVAATTARFLEINIDELKKILADVEKCCEIETSRSWEGSVDSMGGSFDESELRGRDGWI